MQNSCLDTNSMDKMNSKRKQAVSPVEKKQLTVLKRGKTGESDAIINDQGETSTASTGVKKVTKASVSGGEVSKAIKAAVGDAEVKNEVKKTARASVNVAVVKKVVNAEHSADTKKIRRPSVQRSSNNADVQSPTSKPGKIKKFKKFKKVSDDHEAKNDEAKESLVEVEQADKLVEHKVEAVSSETKEPPLAFSKQTKPKLVDLKAEKTPFVLMENALASLITNEKKSVEVLKKKNVKETPSVEEKSLIYLRKNEENLQKPTPSVSKQTQSGALGKSHTSLKMNEATFEKVITIGNVDTAHSVRVEKSSTALKADDDKKSRKISKKNFAEKTQSVSVSIAQGPVAPVKSPEGNPEIISMKNNVDEIMEQLRASLIRYAESLEKISMKKNSEESPSIVVETSIASLKLNEEHSDRIPINIAKETVSALNEKSNTSLSSNGEAAGTKSSTDEKRSVTFEKSLNQVDEKLLTYEGK